MALCAAVLGISAGAGVWLRLGSHLGARLREWEQYPQVPRPTSMAWLEQLLPPRFWLELGERFAIGAGLVAFAAFLWLLACLWGPGLSLRVRDEENPGTGLRAHVDPRRVLRAFAASLLSLWLVGALAPVVHALLPGTRTGPGLLTLGGVQIWTGWIGGGWGTTAAGVLLGLGAALLWGPGGLSGARRQESRGEHLVLGAMLGAASAPGLALFLDASVALEMASTAYGLADEEGLRQLLLLALFLPPAGALLASAPWQFCLRPRPGSRIAALALALVGGFSAPWVRTVEGELLRSLDIGVPGLRRRLGLRSSPLQRYALLLTPERSAALSVVEDGSRGPFRDRIACDGETVQAAERFLEQTQYRSALTFRAYSHLQDCSSLDWLDTLSLRRNLEMLERSPTPVAGQLLLERLRTCSTAKANLAVLDILADPKRFTWREPDGDRWLGAAYLRFGRGEQARRHLLKARLSERELRSLLGGVSPLADGTVRGRLRLRGRPQAGIRVGLVRADFPWQEMAGICRPNDWRYVFAGGHTDEEGRFVVRHVAEGEYLMVLTGGGIGRFRGGAVIGRHPGSIKLDSFRPEADLGTIDIDFDPRVPVEGDRAFPDVAGSPVGGYSSRM